MVMKKKKAPKSAKATRKTAPAEYRDDKWISVFENVKIAILDRLVDVMRAEGPCGDCLGGEGGCSLCKHSGIDRGAMKAYRKLIAVTLRQGARLVPADAAHLADYMEKAS